MVRTMSGRRHLGTGAEDARALLKRAAEICVERHGVSKTTMEDIAREVGVARPSVYRYFRDRDDIFLAVLADRSRALLERAHRYMAKHPTFADKLVEGLLFIADHGRRDPFTRHLLGVEDGRYAQTVMATGAGALSAGEFWGPILDEAAAAGEVRDDLDRDLAYDWLAEVGLIVMARLERNEEPVEQVRRTVREFVLPAFVRL